ncbi:MAG: hypothetical protein ACOC53_07260 [Candidatus Saliniplasma sp.]
MREVRPDPDKASALVKMSDKILERVRETDEDRFPSQVLRDYYDVLRQLMEAIACLNGVKSQGLGAHQQLIDWLVDEYNLSEGKRQFLHQIRRHRNRFEYEGYFVNKEYIVRNKPKIDEIIVLLKDILDQSL